MPDTMPTAARQPMAILGAWWPVLAGLLLLYLPTYYDLANGIWNSEEHAHGPIVLAVSLFLIWQNRHLLLSAMPANQGATATNSVATHADRRPKLGWTLLILGLLFYALGRSQEILLFEVGSQVPVLLGALLITVGSKAARTLWFALFFLLFMVPLPGFLVDSATGPLKQHISEIAEHLLYAAGYPIARSGVTLTVGPYQLLVADACSGLHSMFSLSAMGLLYLYLMGHKSWTRNGILIASILPIAFVANVIRVMILVLVTYHFGDEAGQGFVHGFAGIVLFVIALLILFALDGLLGMFFKTEPPTAPAAAAQTPVPAVAARGSMAPTVQPAMEPSSPQAAGDAPAQASRQRAEPAPVDRDLAMECRRQSFLLHYDPGEKDTMEWLLKVADSRGWN